MASKVREEGTVFWRLLLFLVLYVDLLYHGIEVFVQLFQLVLEGLVLFSLFLYDLEPFFISNKVTCQQFWFDSA